MKMQYTFELVDGDKVITRRTLTLDEKDMFAGHTRAWVDEFQIRSEMAILEHIIKTVPEHPNGKYYVCGVKELEEAKDKYPTKTVVPSPFIDFYEFRKPFFTNDKRVEIVIRRDKLLGHGN